MLDDVKRVHSLAPFVYFTGPVCYVNTFGVRAVSGCWGVDSTKVRRFIFKSPESQNLFHFLCRDGGICSFWMEQDLPHR